MQCINLIKIIHFTLRVYVLKKLLKYSKIEYKEKTMKEKEKNIIIILVIVLILIDQILKIVLYNTSFKIMAESGWGIGIINNTKTENNLVYILISILAVMALVRYIKSNNTFIKMNSRVILSFSIAGAISNAIDRVWNGGTINYIIIPNFSALNFSYVYFIITWIGMAVILTKYTSDRIKEKKERK